MEEQQPEVTIIGAGMVGLCCALSLQERGYRVHILDKVAPAEGCSFGNAGILASSSCIPLSMPGLWRDIPEWLADPDGPMAINWGYLPRLAPWLLKFIHSGRRENLDAVAAAMLAVNAPSVEMYRHLLAQRGHEQLIKDASWIFIYNRPQEINLNALDWQTRIRFGAEVAQLNRQELAALEPDISPAYQAAVEIRHQGLTVNPARLGKSLAECILDQGGHISRCEVHRLSTTGGGTRLETSMGEFQASQLIICAGAWSAELARQLGCHIPLESERGYHLTIENPGVKLNNTVTVAKNMFAMTSMEMGLRCAGTTELGGLKSPPNYRRARNLGKIAQRVLPGLKIERSSEWMGHRPSVPDSVPVISRLPGYEKVFIACGHGHLGLTAAPMTGRIMASLLMDEPTNLDTRPYRAERF